MLRVSSALVQVSYSPGALCHSLTERQADTDVQYFKDTPGVYFHFDVTRAVDLKADKYNDWDRTVDASNLEMHIDTYLKTSQASKMMKDTVDVLSSRRCVISTRELNNGGRNSGFS